MIIVRQKKGNDKSWEIHYEHTDVDEIAKELKCPWFVAKELCNYLESENDLLKVKANYDPQSGWLGKDILVGGKNLAVNGYCYKIENLIDFLEDHEKLREKGNITFAKAKVLVIVDLEIGDDLSNEYPTDDLICAKVLKTLETPTGLTGSITDLKVTNIQILQKK